MCACASAFGQTSDNLSSWASQHPDVYLISFENYNLLSQEMKDKLGTNILVYNGSLTMEAIESFEQTKSIPNEKPSTEVADGQEIKNWLGQHPDVKIVSRSVYSSSDATAQQAYVEYGALILIGETITLEDIHNY